MAQQLADLQSGYQDDLEGDSLKRRRLNTMARSGRFPAAVLKRMKTEPTPPPWLSEAEIEELGPGETTFYNRAIENYLSDLQKSGLKDGADGKYTPLFAKWYALWNEVDDRDRRHWDDLPPASDAPVDSDEVDPGTPLRGTGQMDPETAYDGFVDAILPSTGTKETTQEQLDTYGHALMPGFYRGAHARGKEPPDDGTAHFFIVNGMTGPPGDHWHGVYREPGKPDLVYDSYGRGTRGFEGRGTERDAEQSKSGWDKDTCGPRCLAWGLVARHYGQRAHEV